MKITLLKDEKGAGRFGTCNLCAKSAGDDPKMRRLSFKGTSVCLCAGCFKKVKELMSGQD